MDRHAHADGLGGTVGWTALLPRTNVTQCHHSRRIYFIILLFRVRDWSFGSVIFQNGVFSRGELTLTWNSYFFCSIVINFARNLLRASETLEQDIRRKSEHLFAFQTNLFFFFIFVTKSGELLLSFEWKIAETALVRIAFRTNFPLRFYSHKQNKKCNVMSSLEKKEEKRIKANRDQ